MENLMWAIALSTLEIISWIIIAAAMVAFVLLVIWVKAVLGDLNRD